jgi:hypothetical protein
LRGHRRWPWQSINVAFEVSQQLRCPHYPYDDDEVDEYIEFCWDGPNHLMQVRDAPDDL